MGPVDNEGYIRTSPQYSHRNIKGTMITLPHSASYSDAAIEVQPKNPSEEVACILSGKWPKNPVNPKVKPKVKLIKG